MKIKNILIVIIVALLSCTITYIVVKKGNPAPAGDQKETHSEHKEQEEHEEHGESSGHGEEAHAKIEIKGLKVEPAVSGKGYTTVTATGKVAIPSDKMVKVCPRIGGKIVKVNVQSGADVRQGDVLAVISSIELANARSEYGKALAILSAAQKKYMQDSKMVELGANSLPPLEGARTEFLNAQAALSDARNDVIRARSELDQCKARLDRAKELYNDMIISKQELDTAENEFHKDSADLDQAEVNYKKARARLDIAREYLEREKKMFGHKVADTKILQAADAEVEAAAVDVKAAADRIRILGANPNGEGETIGILAPISGRIVTRGVNTGEMVSQADVLFTVLEPSQVWIDADVYEKDFAGILKGQPAEITVSAYPDKVFKGRVDYISDLLNSETRTAKVRCVVENPDELLKGEMFATISIITAQKGKVVLIPKQAVLDDAGKKIVFVPCMECDEDKKAGKSICGSFDRVEVTTGNTRGSKIEILSGLEPGVSVVTEGQYQLKTAQNSGKLEAGCSHGH